MASEGNNKISLYMLNTPYLVAIGVAIVNTILLTIIAVKI